MITITSYKKLQSVMEESLQVLIAVHKPGDVKAYAFKKIVGTTGANVDIIPVSEAFYKTLLKDRVTTPIVYLRILPDKLNTALGIFPQVEEPEPK